MTCTDPHRLAELFIKDRTDEVSDQTLYNNRGHLKEFTNWCAESDITNIRDLGGEELLEYKFHLKQDPDKKETTISNHFSTLRVFFKFCQTLDATTPNQDLYTKLKSLDFAKGNASRDDMLDTDELKAVLDYLKQFKYAQVRHVIFVILWHTGCRAGALRGLDLGDYKPVKQREHGRYGLLQFKHRPETGTPLKNGNDDKKQGGEREVMVWPEYGEIIEDYIAVHRRDVTDKYGRQPLVTSPHGRYTVSNIQANVYAMTRPCMYGKDCPHNRDPETCEAAYHDKASKCPSSVSPHPLRRTAITHHLEELNWTYEGASGRFDVSVKTLKEHYDESTQEGQRRTRAAQFFDGDQATL